MRFLRPTLSLIVLLWILAPSIASSQAGPSVRPEAAAPREAAIKAEILWDRYGIPHIFADTEEDLFYAYGWAQAENHGNLLLSLYGQARGRAAEYFGDQRGFDGAPFLDGDRWVHTMGTYERGRAAFEAAPPEWQRYLSAFARGINDYANAHPDNLSADARRVLPVDGVDVLAHGDRVAVLWIASWDVELARRWGAAAPGSNGWAIGPARSASGHALLLANPHLPWADMYTFFEAQLVAPGIDAYGATLVGFPVLAIAFNDQLGWTHTTNTADAADRYELTLAGDGYLFDGEVRQFTAEARLLQVRQEDGTLRTDTLVVRRSVHGPVLAVRDGRAIAVRFAATEPGTAVRQWWNMARATTLDDFERALGKMEIARQNILYADRDGNILFSHGAPVPDRPHGDRAFWEAVVPGDASETLWQRTHSYDEIPNLTNPTTGWLQNANEGPWWATYPPELDPQDYPPYMAPRGLSFRPQRSIRMLREAGPLTFEEMIRLKHSSRMELADRVLPDLLVAVQEHGDEDARAGADLLREWDRTAEAGSRGGVLFAAWVQSYAARTSGRPYGEPWSPGDPLETPRGLVDAATAAAALGDVARQVRQTHGRVDVPWGDVHRYRIDDVDLPGNGGPGGLGIFRNIAYTNGIAMGGDSYVAAIEFSQPVRARALLAYGNASQEHSPHRTDQIGYMARGKLREVWRTREEIEANLSRRTTF
jgi:acyl-homoserine-lactone acylase